MKTLCCLSALAEAYALAATVCPRRSPKPVLESVRFEAALEGATLAATDLEVAVSVAVAGVTVDVAGRALLSARFGQILRTSRDDELALEVDGETLTARGVRSEFHLPTDDPDLFPAPPAFPEGPYLALSAGDLRTLIRRTAFATDAESVRYALGGVLVERDGAELAFVATDGRRLARQAVPCEADGDPVIPPSPVVPPKALKLLDRVLGAGRDDDPVHLAFAGDKTVFARCGGAVVSSRLVEGRFPRYRDVFPSERRSFARLTAGPLFAAVAQAAVATSDESRGLDFAFGPGSLRIAAQAADVGTSRVELPAAHEGPAVAVTLDSRYLPDMLKSLDPDAEVAVELVDAKNAVVLRAGEAYCYVVMPLTRDR